MKKGKKIVQGAFITKEAKAAINREAKRREVFPGTLAAEILEREAQSIIRKENRYGENPADVR